MHINKAQESTIKEHKQTPIKHKKKMLMHINRAQTNTNKTQEKDVNAHQ